MCNIENCKKQEKLLRKRENMGEKVFEFKNKIILFVRWLVVTMKSIFNVNDFFFLGLGNTYVHTGVNFYTYISMYVHDVFF